MADFRKWIYALAVVALLAGFTVPVSAQNAPFQCIANAGVPPIVRAEGYTELTGDLTLNCNGCVSDAGRRKRCLRLTFTDLVEHQHHQQAAALKQGLWNEALLTH